MLDVNTPAADQQKNFSGSEGSAGGGASYSYMLVQCNHYVCTNCANLYKGKDSFLTVLFNYFS